jgi:S1-C subfamily serine protease
MKTAITAVAIVVMALTACTSSKSGPSAVGSASVAPPSAAASAVQSAYIDTVRRTLPSVVEITTSAGLGSGVVLDTDGDIVTNAHVVGRATTFTVSLVGTSANYRATLLGTFAPDDLAVIRVSGAGNLHPLPIGDSSKLQVGATVMAIGNPLGLSGSVTQGIVSALGRTVTEPASGSSPGATIPNAIQTSAEINPGNSGGALVDLSGQLVGIPTLAAVDPEIGQGGSAAPGIGFAISSNMVAKIAKQLVATGKVTNSGRAALGVTVQPVADASGNPVGVGIVSVTPGGPAAAAGLKAGEVITAVNGITVTTPADLANVLAQLAPGQRATVTVVTAGGGAARNVPVTLGELSSR